MIKKLTDRYRKDKSKCVRCLQWKPDLLTTDQARFVGGWCWSCRTQQIRFATELTGGVLVVRLDGRSDESLESAARHEIERLPREEDIKNALRNALSLALAIDTKGEVNDIQKMALD